MVRERIASYAAAKAKLQQRSGTITPKNLGYDGNTRGLMDDISKDFGLKGWGRTEVGTREGPVKFLFTMPPYSINPQMFFYFT